MTVNGRHINISWQVAIPLINAVLLLGLFYTALESYFEIKSGVVTALEQIERQREILREIHVMQRRFGERISAVETLVKHLDKPH